MEKDQSYNETEINRNRKEFVMKDPFVNEVNQQLAEAVKAILLQHFKEEEIISHFGDLSYCDETKNYASWICKTIRGEEP